jgi:hypothetical protein
MHPEHLEREGVLLIEAAKALAAGQSLGEFPLATEAEAGRREA